MYIFLLLIFSCSKKTDIYKWGYFSDVQISFDTLVIDPNNEILYINSEIKGSDTSIDKNYLYNFNTFDNTLEKINLDELRLEKKLPFEKDGPDGTGQFIGFMNIPSENHMLIKGLNKSELFNLNGEKSKVIHYENFFLGLGKEGEVLISSPLVDFNFDRLFVLIKNELVKSYALGILDIETYEIRKISLDTFQVFHDYTFNLRISGIHLRNSQKVYLDRFDRKLVLSDQVSNELLVYDIELDTLYLKCNNSKLHADKKVGIYEMEHETEGSWLSEFSRFHQEINYLPPFWDNKNQVFFRFSYEELPTESQEEEHIKSKIYLSVLDKNLNLIGEVYLPLLDKRPETPYSNPFPKHFAKDGKIWIFENINDEMGFIVLNISN